MKKYQISIIIPIYSAEPYLRQALDSVLRQSIGHENLEVIMVDDQSPDGCPDIMAEYASAYPNFISIRREGEKGGVSAARNLGLSRATAHYVMFLDADDFYADNACRVLFDAITSKTCDQAFGYRCIVDKDGNITEKKEAANHFVEDRYSSAIDDFCDPYILTAFYTHIYKKSLLDCHGIQFPEITSSEDTVFSLECLLAARGISYVDQMVYHYRKDTQNAASLNSRRDYNFYASKLVAKQLEHALFFKYGRPDLFLVMRGRNHIRYILNLLIGDESLPEAEFTALMPRLSEFLNLYDCACLESCGKDAIMLQDALAQRDYRAVSLAMRIMAPFKKELDETKIKKAELLAKYKELSARYQRLKDKREEQKE